MKLQKATAVWAPPDYQCVVTVEEIEVPDEIVEQEPKTDLDSETA